MSAAFASASSQYLVDSAVPVTAVPFSVGFWVYPRSSAAIQSMWSLADSGTTNNWFELKFDTTPVFQLSSAAGGVGATTNVGAVTLNGWTYIVARFISATNRRMAQLNPAGTPTHGQNTTSRVPTGIDRVALGVRAASAPTLYFNGYIAEYWLANVDIQPDGAQLQDSLLRQLAYGGPFSVPDIRDSIVSYRSFRSSLGSVQDKPDEAWSPQPQTWGNTNGVSLAPHPPLPSWHEGPASIVRPAVPI